jgi:hypothetical protein
VFRVPRGSVTLTVRARRFVSTSDAVTIGEYRALTDRARAEWSALLLREVPLLVLAALFAFVFLHHLLLFSRRRQGEHLWFSLLALAFSMNTFASTYWIYELTASHAIAVRITDSTGHLAAACALQFLWTFFGRRISRLLRAYQLSHLAWALFVVFSPDVQLVFATGTVRWLWLLPLLVIAAALVLREAWRGDAEARIIAAGGAIMVVVQVGELLRNVLPIPRPFDFSIAAFGFGAVILAMSVALSLRFRRVHDELDRLRTSPKRKWSNGRATQRRRATKRSPRIARRASSCEHQSRDPHADERRDRMAELLATTSLTPEQRAAQGHSGQRAVAAHAAQHILEFSRLEAKTLSMQHEPFQLRSVIDDCLEILGPLARTKGLTLRSSIAEARYRR